MNFFIKIFVIIIETEKKLFIMGTNLFCLFDRHDLPKNNGAIFESFDFKSFKGKRTKQYNIVLKLLRQGESVKLLITGLTPALTQFLHDTKNVKGKLYLLHYDKNKKDYVEQIF